MKRRLAERVFEALHHLRRQADIRDEREVTLVMHPDVLDRYLVSDECPVPGVRPFDVQRLFGMAVLLDPNLDPHGVRLRLEAVA